MISTGVSPIACSECRSCRPTSVRSISRLPQRSPCTKFCVSVRAGGDQIAEPVRHRPLLSVPGLALIRQHRQECLCPTSFVSSGRLAGGHPFASTFIPQSRNCGQAKPVWHRHSCLCSVSNYSLLMAAARSMRPASAEGNRPAATEARNVTASESAISRTGV